MKFNLGDYDLVDLGLGDFSLGDLGLGDFNLGDFDLIPIDCNSKTIIKAIVSRCAIDSEFYEECYRQIYSVSYH